jgi:hypothetical protein
MLITAFEKLPESARVWVYGTDRKLDSAAESILLNEVDNYLTTWSAHGVPLSAARNWGAGRFLTIAVDQEQAGASGCSIDGLFRTLKALEQRLRASIITSGLVFFRGKDGEIHSVTRDKFSELGGAGEVGTDTEVFDLSVTTLGEWHSAFSLRAGDSWHSVLLAAPTN